MGRDGNGNGNGNGDARVCDEAQGVHPTFMFKLILVGDSGVGKSCLLRAYRGGSFLCDMDSTIGVDFAAQKVWLDEKRGVLPSTEAFQLRCLIALAKWLHGSQTNEHGAAMEQPVWPTWRHNSRNVQTTPNSFAAKRTCWLRQARPMPSVLCGGSKHWAR
ncbi:MAG: hypothetical protein EB075_12195 [Bacteroidetes bacterium]|nr:hypothetical protein [Bacteroidota bacterium]